MTYNDTDIEMAELEAAANAAAAVQGGTDVLTASERDYVVTAAADAGWYGNSILEAVTYGLHDVAAMRAPQGVPAAKAPPVRVPDATFDDLFAAAADRYQQRERAEEAERRGAR